jgi:hypothetical protein
MKARGILLSLALLGAGLYVLNRGGDSKDERLERVAEVEHEQWMAWSKSVADEVSPERRARWSKLWVPYGELSEEEKEKDREWARKALQAARGKEAK